MFDDARKRWWALYVLCSGVLMIVLDTTIVNVAAALDPRRPAASPRPRWSGWSTPTCSPSAASSLLGGRLGDLYGHRQPVPARAHPVHRRVDRPAASRTSQGIADRRARDAGPRRRGRHGGRAVAHHGSVHRDRPNARKPWASTASCAPAGGSIGVLLGGFLTTALNWHWIFLVNAADRRAACTFVLQAAAASTPGTASGAKLDVAGAITVTTLAHARRVRDRERPRGRLDARRRRVGHARRRAVALLIDVL